MNIYYLLCIVGHVTLASSKTLQIDVSRYEVSTVTSDVRGAGTDSSVWCVLKGS